MFHENRAKCKDGTLRFIKVVNGNELWIINHQLYIEETINVIGHPTSRTSLLVIFDFSSISSNVLIITKSVRA